MASLAWRMTSRHIQRIERWKGRVGRMKKIIAMWSVHSTMTSCAPMIFHRTELVLPPVSHSCHEGKN